MVPEAALFEKIEEPRVKVETPLPPALGKETSCLRRISPPGMPFFPCHIGNGVRRGSWNA